jgi:hypothetical protein
MTTPIRLSPSGPIIGGTPVGAGSGVRLRLLEASTPMGGSQAIPTVPEAIGPDGFGAAVPLVLTLDSPKQNLRYRANLSLDVVNNSTNVGGEVVLYLEVSVDGGTTFTSHAQNAHVINAGHGDITGRQMQVWMPLTLGSALGVNDTTPTATIKLRARANQVLGESDALLVSSLASSHGMPPVIGLNGTIHMELEECL